VLSTTSPSAPTRLRRLDDLRPAGTATILVDHHDADWSRLWWVRIRGQAMVDQHDDDAAAVAALVAKYAQYRERPPRAPSTGSPSTRSSRGGRAMVADGPVSFAGLPQVFHDVMTVADVYADPINQYDHHRRQLATRRAHSDRDRGRASSTTIRPDRRRSSTPHAGAAREMPI
jgi:hypothetical protein